MADRFDAATRSRMMASIGRKNTRPEVLVRTYLHAAGLRYRIHDGRLPGRPDIVLPRLKTAIFVHGCFWHRHANCRFAAMPTTRANFWNAKFNANVARDRAATKSLRAMGWSVIVFWECDAADEMALDGLVWTIRAKESLP